MPKEIKRIEPVTAIRGSVRLPGSKSITHRALLLAALADGPCTVHAPLASEDTLLTSKALEALGVGITWERDRVLVVPPEKRWHSPAEPILLGNSGTSMRLLLALAATGTGTFVFDGSDRLRERPIGPVLGALRSLGVQCRCLGQEGFPPVEITSRGLPSGTVWIDASQSSQFFSALLLAAPRAAGELRVGWRGKIASFPYVALTLTMMERAGLKYNWVNDNQIAVPAPQAINLPEYTVEGDCSSASYFWAAAAITGGETFTAPISQGSIQGDCGLLQVLERMGCRVIWEEDGVRVVGPERLQPVDLDMNTIPDMVPTLAVVAAFAEGRSVIRNVAHLRVKESDRLCAVASELDKLGVPVQELADGLIIDGGKVRSPAQGIESHDDHRIAMAFSLAGLRVKGVEIHGAEAVSKSFPCYWNEFERVCMR